MFRFIFLILSSFFIFDNPLQGAFSEGVGAIIKLKNEEKNFEVNEILKISMGVSLYYSERKGEKIFKSLGEAKEYLKCLLKKREILVGDFFGINLTAYRYVNVFDRMSYIRYKIMHIDKEIKKTKLKISELRKKFRK